MTAPSEHIVQFHDAGSYHSWTCSCGTGSRHLLPYYKASRNANAHVSKAKRAASKDSK